MGLDGDRREKMKLTSESLAVGKMVSYSLVSEEEEEPHSDYQIVLAFFVRTKRLKIDRGNPSDLGHPSPRIQYFPPLTVIGRLHPPFRNSRCLPH